ncbi:flagellar biosynthesis protein FliQ [Novosphingobium sp. FSY-8]|uniref:Flagellar biosynthetic protein FliQ n=1 Tax=Novosphingobium ovatum TaxID=1908523 RepID=A0ABW9XG53_9SPHN|nr:flagellar biosynthesis protein FliQ [Novosphingobium ovatum]NBC37520.1 flagellar biosynthesis protein FliQ [Novosphingobium ovatum]
MDDITPMLALADRMLWIAMLCAAPVLLATLAVGLVISVLQAATSVNEQTLTFIPKLIVTALVLVLFGASMMGLIGDFTKDIFAAIARLGTEAGR